MDDRDNTKQGQAGEFIGNPIDDAQRAREEADEAANALLERKMRQATKDPENPESDTTKETEDALDFLRTK